MLTMNKLKHLRETRGLTQTELADAIGVNQAYISKIEAGTANPSLEKINLIASALKAQPSELFSLPDLEARILAAVGKMPGQQQKEAAVVVLEAMARDPK